MKKINKQKQNERKQIRRNRNEDNTDIGWCFKMTTTNNKIFVTSLNLHEIRKKIRLHWRF